MFARQQLKQWELMCYTLEWMCLCFKFALSFYSNLFREDNNSNLNCYQIGGLGSLVRNRAYPYLDVELFRDVGVVYCYLGL